MSYLQKSYLLNSRRDLVSKSNSYKNINQLSCINKVHLSFSGIKNKPMTILGVGFLYLITYKKGKIPIKLRSSFTKDFNCKLLLSRDESFLFIEYFLNLVTKNIIDLEEGFSKSNFSKTGTFSFTIKDIYAFSELEDNLFKFKDLKNLNLSINLSSRSVKENIELLRSLGYMFKD